MVYVRWLNEIGNPDQDSVGDKAAVLGELTRAGFSVPRAFCIGASAYRDTFAANGLNAKIIAQLNQIEITDPAQLEQAATEIRGWIENAPLSKEFETEIQAALAELNAPLTAVRVSRINHDVPNPSASGMQQAHLAVPAAAVLDHVRKSWAAPWNSRAIYFRQRKKIPPEQVAMAVVVQTMINADAAGVMFTASPMGKTSDEIHIDAIWGLGEAVVAARWRPDHFTIEKGSSAVREKIIASKTVMDVAAAEGGVQTVGVPEEKQEAACLSDAQITELGSIGKKVETQFKALQDIEWCIKDNQVYLLQTRPMLK